MPTVIEQSSYNPEQVAALYELGRMYYEMGYFTPAERIFNGLAVVDATNIPVRVALGLLKLERSQYSEAAGHFRSCLQIDRNTLEAKIGLCFSFLAAGERTRVRSVLEEIVKTSVIDETVNPDVRALFYSLVELYEERN